MKIMPVENRQDTPRHHQEIVYLLENLNKKSLSDETIKIVETYLKKKKG